MKNLLFLLALALMLSSCDPGPCEVIEYDVSQYNIKDTYIENRSDHDVSLSKVYFFAPIYHGDTYMAKIKPEIIAKPLRKNTRASVVDVRVRVDHFYPVYKLQVGHKYYFFMPHVSWGGYRDSYGAAKLFKENHVIGIDFFREMTRDNVYATTHYMITIIVEDDKVGYIRYGGSIGNIENRKVYNP